MKWKDVFAPLATRIASEPGSREEPKVVTGYPEPECESLFFLVSVGGDTSALERSDLPKDPPAEYIYGRS